VDDTKPESVVRLLGGDVSEDARKAAVNKVHAIALGCLGLGALGLFYAAAAMAAGSTAYTVLAMLGLAVFGGYAYQGPPFRLSYKRLGEPICFAAFGPLATGAFYLALVSVYAL
jgi:2-carboxy-1,4-naphthoquinone phytyltransferase